MFAPRILLTIVFPGLLNLLINREDEVITILLPMFSVQDVRTYFHSLTETLPPSQFLPQTQTVPIIPSSTIPSPYIPPSPPAKSFVPHQHSLESTKKRLGCRRKKWEDLNERQKFRRIKNHINSLDNKEEANMLITRLNKKFPHNDFTTLPTNTSLMVAVKTKGLSYNQVIGMIIFKKFKITIFSNYSRLSYL